MFKCLPPKSGLWHIGEQCAKDLYMIMEEDSEEKYFEIDMIDFHSYEYGMFQGKSIEEAKNWKELNKSDILST